MTDHDARSSDRQALRALAHRLRPDGEPAPPAASPLRFVRLPATSLTARRPTPAPSDVSGSTGWGRLLDWCVIDMGVELAVLTDDSGLVIACTGDGDNRLIEGIAARLVTAFQQANRIDDRPAPTLAIELQDRWLTGLRITGRDGPLVLGLVSTGVLDAPLRSAVVAAFTEKAAD